MAASQAPHPQATRNSLSSGQDVQFCLPCLAALSLAPLSGISGEWGRLIGQVPWRTEVESSVALASLVSLPLELSPPSLLQL